MTFSAPSWTFTSAPSLLLSGNARWPTELYCFSLHDALPILSSSERSPAICSSHPAASAWARARRSEEHTSELQSHSDLVCRLLLEKKKKKSYIYSVI